jgi:hypothetical protein
MSAKRHASLQYDTISPTQPTHRVSSITLPPHSLEWQSAPHPPHGETCSPPHWQSKGTTPESIESSESVIRDQRRTEASAGLGEAFRSTRARASRGNHHQEVALSLASKRRSTTSAMLSVRRSPLERCSSERVLRFAFKRSTTSTGSLIEVLWRVKCIHRSLLQVWSKVPVWHKTSDCQRYLAKVVIGHL